MVRKFVISVMLLAMILQTGAYAQSLSVSLNGKPVAFSQTTGAPYQDSSGRVMMPLRVILDQVGASADFDGSAQSVAVRAGQKTVTIPIGKYYILANGINIPIDTPAVIKNGRTYLPIRAVMEAIDYTATWNGGTQTVSIDTNTAVSVLSPVPALPAAIPSTTPVSVNSEGNSTANLHGGGLIAQENDDLFVVNFREHNQIWHINTKTGKTEAFSGSNAKAINVVGGWVYYLAAPNEGRPNQLQVFRKKIGTTSTELLVSEPTNYLKVIGKNVYFHTEEYLGKSEVFLRMDPDGTSRETISTDAMTNISVDGSTLRYYHGGLLDKISLITKEHSSQNQQIAVDRSTIIGDTLYTVPSYSNQQQPMLNAREALNLESGKRYVVSNTCYPFTVDGSAMYFISGPKELTRTALDGTNPVKLSTEWDCDTTSQEELKKHGVTHTYSPLFMAGDFIYGYKSINDPDTDHEWIRIRKDGSGYKIIKNIQDFVE